MQGAHLSMLEVKLPYVGIIRIRFLGCLSTGLRQYPRSLIFKIVFLLFYFLQFDLIETFPVFTGYVDVAGFGIEGDAVQHIGIIILKLVRQQAAAIDGSLYLTT